MKNERSKVLQDFDSRYNSAPMQTDRLLVWCDTLTRCAYVLGWLKANGVYCVPDNQTEFETLEKQQDMATREKLPLDVWTEVHRADTHRVEVYPWHKINDEGQPLMRGMLKDMPVYGARVRFWIGAQAFELGGAQDYGSGMQKAYYVDQVLKAIRRTRTYNTAVTQTNAISFECCKEPITRIALSYEAHDRGKAGWMREQLAEALTGLTL